MQFYVEDYQFTSLFIGHIGLLIVNINIVSFIKSVQLVIK